MLVIEYGHSISQIVGKLNPEVCQVISDTLSYEIPNFDRTDAYLYKSWDGKLRLFHKKSKYFPTGLLNKVEAILNEYDVPYEIDGRVFPEILGDIDDSVLRDYQVKAVLDAVEAGRGLIHHATAAGKSFSAVGIISLIGRKSLVIVHRKELAQQMVEHCEKQGLRVKLLQGKNSVEQAYKSGWGADVYVAMSQTLTYARKNTERLFYSLTEVIETLIIDEVHKVSAENYYDTVMAFDETPYKYGCTATVEGRSDNADMKLIAATGEVVSRETESTLMRQGWIATPKISMLECDATHDNRYEWASIYREGIVTNTERNEYIRDVVYHLASQGKMVLVLCNYIKHGMILKDMINEEMPNNLPHVSFLSGKSPQGIRIGELKRFKEASTIALIMSSIGDEGVDLPDCDAVVIASAGMSQIKALQRVGRALRPGSSGQAVVVDFVDKDNGTLLKHSRFRYNAYRQRGFDTKIMSFDAFIGVTNFE